MIKVKDAIESSDFLFLNWFVNRENDDGDIEKKAITFQIRCIDFYQVDMSLVNLSEYNDDEVDSESNLWIMNFDVINLNKKECGGSQLTYRIKLVDSNGVEYSAANHANWFYDSELGKSSRLNKFSPNCLLNPKVKKNGSIAFELPDSFGELFLHVKSGSIETV